MLTLCMDPFRFQPQPKPPDRGMPSAGCGSETLAVTYRESSEAKGACFDLLVPESHVFLLG